MKSNLVKLTVAGMLILASIGAQASEYVAFTTFPEPAEGTFGVVAAALPDGRMVAWNGDGVYLQWRMGIDDFRRIASGYAGDPGFMAVAPDGHTLALGAGFNGDLYLLNVQSPGAATPVINTISNFSGVFADETTLFIDRGIFDFDTFTSTVELLLVDLGQNPPEYRVVMQGDRSASAGIALDPSKQYLYATDGFGDTEGDTRRFAVEDLREAYDSETPIEWNNGELLGTFSGAGPSATTVSGNLVMGGFGSITVVDPETGAIIQSLDPVGTGMEFYHAVYNPVSGDILGIRSTFGEPVSLYAPEESIWMLPVASAPVLFLLIISMLAVAATRMRRA